MNFYKQIPTRTALKANAFASFTGNFQDEQPERHGNASVSEDGNFRSVQLGYSLDPQGVCITLLGASHPGQQDASVDATSNGKILEIIQTHDEAEEAIESLDDAIEYTDNTNYAVPTMNGNDIREIQTTCSVSDGRSIDLIGLSTKHRKSSDQSWWNRLFGNW